ncbi:hypothetical protein [Silvimonas soli]|uniref:hypothetical protein n=1 Tax=Silvimonas soli TaxID=2980100 RepID=UPI0024B383D2|nr:hypothetical protein [Silvimonas soli]
MPDLFYLQDSRTYIGNDMVFWAIENKGYTTDLNKAQKYTKEAAMAQNNLRDTDIPWPCPYIEARTRPAVDMQYVSKGEALYGTGIILKRQAPAAKRETFKCQGCGRFMTEKAMWEGTCPHCGADSRP